MSRSDDLRLADILETSYLIRVLVDRGREAFEHDPAIKPAIERCLEIIGEAAGAMTDEFRRSTPGVAWSDVRRLRIVLAHHYHRVDPDQLWTMATIDIPEMVIALGDRR